DAEDHVDTVLATRPRHRFEILAGEVDRLLRVAAIDRALLIEGDDREPVRIARDEGLGEAEQPDAGRAGLSNDPDHLVQGGPAVEENGRVVRGGHTKRHQASFPEAGAAAPTAASTSADEQTN